MSDLYYTTEAGYDWNKALPVGNGRLGAMIFGNARSERLQLNEDSLWYGGPMNRVNKDALPRLSEVRELILSGKIKEAQDIMLHNFSGNPPSMRPYAPLGELGIMFRDIEGECIDYFRKLNLETALHIVERSFESISFTEEIFASAVENAIIIYVDSKDGSGLNLDVDCGRMSFYDKAFHDESNVYFNGKTAGTPYSFCAGMSAKAESGEIRPEGQYLVCRDVKKLVIIFTAATSYRGEDPFEYVRERLDAVRQKSYDELKNDHIEEYRKYYSKCELLLDYDKNLDRLPTDVRLRKFSAEAPDNGLVKTYFDFGRYLLISSSRPGSLPANLQGIWNKDIDPPWGCKYTVNINTQMNYWPAEMFGLAACHMPLFELMKKMQPNGQKVAKEMYGCRGFVCHHNTDLWGDCAPQDLWIPGTYWVMSVPWLCTHIWQHYVYSLDIDFLKEMYPLMKDSVLFFHDYLIEKDGNALICPSVSPENTYILPDGTEGSICAGSSMDNEILRDHFEQFIKAYKLVEDDDPEFLENTVRLLEMIPPIKIGKHGQIMEWLEDYEEKEPGHRHISQLYALHPSHQIDVEKTPELAEAAKKTIERRLSFGGGHTGWSRAWIMNMFARLHDSEKCYENLVALFKQSTLDNLFDNHPPFQIDGNFGSIAAIGEMLLQADGEDIVLLPALPAEFLKGSIRGLRVPGGAMFSLEWDESGLKEFSVSAGRTEYHANVTYKGKRFKLDMELGECAHFEIYNE